MAINQKQVKRMIDANFNRCKEGLRVCEDICRYVLNKRSLTKQFKQLRHDLTIVVEDLSINDLLQSRSIETDVGRATITSESTRKNIADIFYANLQRVKESLRVLEEMLKLFQAPCASRVKEIRYAIYALEKKAARAI